MVSSKGKGSAKGKGPAPKDKGKPASKRPAPPFSSSLKDELDENQRAVLDQLLVKERARSFEHEGARQVAGGPGRNNRQQST